MKTPRATTASPFNARAGQGGAAAHSRSGDVRGGIFMLTNRRGRVKPVSDRTAFALSFVRARTSLRVRENFRSWSRGAAFAPDNKCRRRMSAAVQPENERRGGCSLPNKDGNERRWMRSSRRRYHLRRAVAGAGVSVARRRVRLTMSSNAATLWCAPAALRSVRRGPQTVKARRRRARHKICLQPDTGGLI